MINQKKMIDLMNKYLVIKINNKIKIKKLIKIKN